MFWIYNACQRSQYPDVRRRERKLHTHTHLEYFSKMIDSMLLEISLENQQWRENKNWPFIIWVIHLLCGYHIHKCKLIESICLNYFSFCFPNVCHTLQVLIENFRIQEIHTRTQYWCQIKNSLRWTHTLTTTTHNLIKTLILPSSFDSLEAFKYKWKKKRTNPNKNSSTI